MSWWVMEQVSVNEAGTQTLANIQCDDVSDLPAPNQSASLGYVIVRGSQAKVLATSENYILGSAGTWVKMEDGVKLDLTGYATKQYVDDGLANKVDTSVYSSGQAAQDAQIDRLTNEGSKNRLKITASTKTINGVTFTVNADQTVSLSGTASSLITFVIVDNTTANAVPDGSYILSGCPAGGGITTYDLRWYLYSSGRSAYDQGSGAAVNKAGGTTSSNISILIRSGVNVDGVVFKPMLRKSVITDSTFEPYAPTNRELYEMILALQ